MNRENTGFILLPGGGMSSWVWRDLIPLLHNPSFPFDYRLPDNTMEARKNSAIADCVEYIVKTVEQKQLKKIIVVGHSGAGVLAANVAKKIPRKIHHVVYVSANIPPNHTSAVGALPFVLRWLNTLAIRGQVGRDVTPAKRMEKIIRQRFCNTCPEKIIQYVLEQDLLSEPLCLAFEKNNWDNYPAVNQTFVLLTEDKTMSVEGQKVMMNNLQITNSIEIASDHMVMLSHPAELGKFLNSVL